MFRAMLIIGAGALIVGLSLYTLLDALRTPAREERTLPKWLWIPVVLLFPVVGPLLWLLWGRPRRAQAPRPSDPLLGFGQRPNAPAPSVLSPDDDEEYLRWLKAKVERERASREAQRKRESPAPEDKKREGQNPETHNPEDNDPKGHYPGDTSRG